MKKDMYKNLELVLGFNSKWAQYEIIELNKGEGTFYFQVGDDSISDRAGIPAYYDDTYVKIDEKDYRYVVDILHKAGEEMRALAEKHVRPIERSIIVGDYIYDGVYFFHIQDINDNRDKVWTEQFYYDTYSLNLDTAFDAICKTDYSAGEMESESLFITEDIYHQAINIAKSAILEITDYLRRLHTQKLSEKSSDQ